MYFSPIDFRNRLSDRNYQPESDVNVSIFKKITDGPKIIKKTIKVTTDKINDVVEEITKPKKPKKKDLKPEDEIVFETIHLEDIKIKSDGGLSIKDRLPKEKE